MSLSAVFGGASTPGEVRTRGVASRVAHRKGASVESLSGKVAVVTGAASGIGKAMATRFVAEEMKVAAVDIDEGTVRATADEIGASPYRLDVADELATYAVVERIEDDLGPIDLFCFNAGIATGGGVEQPNDAWERAWQVNLMSHVYGARAVLPSMLSRGTGHLLHTASAAGLLTNVGAAPYSVTKHAVVALAEWLSMTYGDQGLKVSCLCPQFVETPMLELFDEGGEMMSWVRSGAIGPDQVADAVVEGLLAEQFLILPHEEVAQFFLNKATDYDRWLGGMRKIQRNVGYEPPDLTGT
jgi:NAD(P)-dependent dehydrogenase (short-subunit alcohol dehydrogenase family)